MTVVAPTLRQVITRKVTEVVLERTTGPEGEPFCVTWSEVRNRKVEQTRKLHFTETAARRHVQGLLKMRAAGLSVDAIYREENVI